MSGRHKIGPSAGIWKISEIVMRPYNFDLVKIRLSCPNYLMQTSTSVSSCGTFGSCPLLNCLP